MDKGVVAGVIVGGAALLVFLIQLVREFLAGLRQGQVRFDAMQQQERHEYRIAQLEDDLREIRDVWVVTGAPPKLSAAIVAASAKVRHLQ